MKYKYEIKRRGYTLKINQTEDIESPREYYKDNNICQMICFHNKHTIGDENSFDGPAEFNIWVEENKDKICAILPLYLQDHTSLTLSTTPFANKWDSGQVGFVYVLNETAEKLDYDINDKEEIEERIQEEISEYNDWLNCWPVYYEFSITNEDDEEIESMGVFEETSFEEVIEEMKERSEHQYDFLFDSLIKKEQQKENCL